MESDDSSTNEYEEYLEKLKNRPIDEAIGYTVFDLNEVIFAIERESTFLNVLAKHQDKVDNEEIQEKTERIRKSTRKMRDILLALKDWDKLNHE